MKRIMVVDDETFQRQVLRETLGRHFPRDDYSVEAFGDPVAALARARAVDVAVVIADFRMPGMNGVAFLREMRRMRPLATRLMLTASADIETAVMALNHAEVFRFIRKPWDASLRQAVIDALQHHDEAVVNDYLRHGAEGAPPVASPTPPPVSADAPASASPVDEHPEARAQREREAKDGGISHMHWGPDGTVMLS